MTKTSNKKPSTKNNNIERIDFPSVVDIDTLSYATDDELLRHAAFLKSERERAVKLDCNVTPWDIEVCYVQRELMIREDRRIAHERYLRLNPEEQTVSNEDYDKYTNSMN